jgi:hypothetical protein
MNGVERLWVVSHEPEGPLVSYLDSFARHLDEQGFKRHLISRQIRSRQLSVNGLKPRQLRHRT